MTAHASERLFLLSSIDDQPQTVELHETRLIIYTAARSGEVLLRVRCYGRSRLLRDRSPSLA